MMVLSSSSMYLVYFLAGLVTFLCLIRKITSFRESLRSVRYLSGYRYLFAPFSFVGLFSPQIPYFCGSIDLHFNEKHTPFAKAGWDVISLVHALPETTVLLFLADADIIKEVTTSRNRFSKPIKEYKAVSPYGPNIIASEGDEWKKIRKISAPAFSDRNNKLVWEETIRIVDALHKIWGENDVTVDNCVDITLQIALSVIAVAGFGRRVSWRDDEYVPEMHKMTFKRALHIMSTQVYLILLLPDRALNISKKTREAKTAYNELRSYMAEMIAERRNSGEVGRHDLLSSLLEANTNNPDIEDLTDTELMANIYIFLLAGHETSAHALAFCLGLLALYPDEQEKLYQHILSVVPDGRLPTYEDMPKLTYCTAVLNETLRMFPIVVHIPKCSDEDTTLVTRNENGECLSIPVPKGTGLGIHTPGLHYNPRYWTNPHQFNPSRFLGDWPRKAFLPFSSGPRACLGRKFTETEVIAVLTLMISRYKVTIKDEPQFAFETFEERKKRVLRAKYLLTLTPIRIPLSFTRRL